MPQDSGDKNRKLPEREDALKIDLPFEDALRAALETKPSATPTPKRRQRSKRQN